jgi:hypothetical protein
MGNVTQPTRFSARRRATAALGAWLALASAPLSAQAPPAKSTPASQPPSYFEFGTVVSLGQRTLDLQAVDQATQRPVRFTFLLATDARTDVVHPGDAVEVIYTSSGKDWTVRRLILLNTSIPKPGPPIGEARQVPPATPIRVTPRGAPPPPPAASSAALGGNADPASAPTGTRGVTLAAGTAAKSAPAPTGSIDLGAAPAKVKTAPVLDVPMGADPAVQLKPLTTKTVAHEMPAAECNRSSADWPSQPLRMAVLDFRYPTEREESHDIGTTGGGSGTAVADLVFARLDSLNEFAMSRGDRTRLYRADFAGAARVGRELGVDAVLAGTFAPVDPPPGSDPDFPPAKSYELRAGIVDTCTGQLLMRLTSVLCPPGLDPNAAANAASCKRLSVTAKQASDPKETATAFKGPLDGLLYPLEHNGPPPGTEGSAGVVTAADNGSVTIKLVAGSTLKPGDQVALHAWRLTKNPTTYTLHNLHDEEIGRVTLSAVKGGTATGTFTGDFPPRPGDTAELIAP